MTGPTRGSKLVRPSHHQPEPPTASRSTERARAAGYASYRQQKNAQAQAVGFRNYSEQSRTYASDTFKHVRREAEAGAQTPLKPRQVLDIYRHSNQFRNRSNYAKDAARAQRIHPLFDIDAFDARYRDATGDFTGGPTGWRASLGQRSFDDYLQYLQQQPTEYVYWYHN